MTYNELIEEKRSLDNNIRSLTIYVHSDGWSALTEAEQELIRSQLIPMILYSKILGQRIKALEHRPDGDSVEIRQLPESKAAE